MPTLHSSGQKMTDRILGLKFIIVWITDIHGLLFPAEGRLFTGVELTQGKSYHYESIS